MLTIYQANIKPTSLKKMHFLKPIFTVTKNFVNSILEVHEAMIRSARVSTSGPPSPGSHRRNIRELIIMNRKKAEPLTNSEGREESVDVRLDEHLLRHPEVFHTIVTDYPGTAGEDNVLVKRVFMDPDIELNRKTMVFNKICSQTQYKSIEHLRPILLDPEFRKIVDSDQYGNARKKFVPRENPLQ